MGGCFFVNWFRLGVALGRFDVGGGGVFLVVTFFVGRFVVSVVVFVVLLAVSVVSVSPLYLISKECTTCLVIACVSKTDVASTTPTKH